MHADTYVGCHNYAYQNIKADCLLKHPFTCTHILKPTPEKCFGSQPPSVCLFHLFRFSHKQLSSLICAATIKIFTAEGYYVWFRYFLSAQEGPLAPALGLVGLLNEWKCLEGLDWLRKIWITQSWYCCEVAACANIQIASLLDPWIHVSLIHSYSICVCVFCLNGTLNP